ncbi:MAG: hypothetical protein NUW02_00780 [Candidatus Campbellbacteria bacterium]|nr:hypothetical protein [Candidatus Campbellbacteria bacterium]
MTLIVAFCALLVRGLITSTSERDAAWQKSVQAPRPSTDDIRKHIPDIIRTHFREHKHSHIEVEYSVVCVNFFLEKMLSGTKSPWESFERVLLETLIEDSRKMRLEAQRGFDILAFETRFMCHEADDDTFAFSPEFIRALSETKARESWVPVSAALLPTPTSMPLHNTK